MKKFFALMLAAMMLLSCTTAFAEGGVEEPTELTTIDSITNGSATWLDNRQEDSDADIDVRVEDVRYTDGLHSFGKEGEAATEIWLQVDATGQIDVTVPLVLVFQTNIDGGDATSPDTYKITNHSSADLVVTKIATTEVKQQKNVQPMTMIAWVDGVTPEEDQYAVQISNIEGAPGTGDGVKETYDLKTASHENDAINGGLFELKKAPANKYDDGTVTNLAVDMKTGRLSFVTSRTDEDGMDDDKGIQLMTITYTVAIDTSDAYGEDITTEETMEKSPLSGNDDRTVHTKIQERTRSAATEGNTEDDE